MDWTDELDTDWEENAWLPEDGLETDTQESLAGPWVPGSGLPDGMIVMSPITPVASDTETEEPARTDESTPVAVTPPFRRRLRRKTTPATRSSTSPRARATTTLPLQGEAGALSPETPSPPPAFTGRRRCCVKSTPGCGSAKGLPLAEKKLQPYIRLRDIWIHAVMRGLKKK
eukprot:15477714-Alexandrium_andersonii.AAC.1